jgi:hypothetical protein
VDGTVGVLHDETGLLLVLDQWQLGTDEHLEERHAPRAMDAHGHSQPPGPGDAVVVPVPAATTWATTPTPNKIRMRVPREFGSTRTVADCDPCHYLSVSHCFVGLPCTRHHGHIHRW